MKACIVVAKFPRTSETFVLRQARSLGAIVAAREQGTPQDGGVEDIEIHKIGYRRWASPWLMRQKRRVKWRLGMNVYRWSEHAQADWQRFLQLVQPTVVLAHFGPNAIACADGCRRSGIPLVVHLHGHDASSLAMSQMYVDSLTEVLEYASAVVVVAEYMRAFVRRLGFDNSRVHTIPCGVPVEDLRMSDRVGEQPCRMLAVGRLVPKKGPLLTLRAFEICAQKVPDVQLVMVGGGPLEAKLRRWIARREIGGRITLTGALPFDEVRNYFESSALFAQHSTVDNYGDMEGWPVVIGEAAASGLPVVATRHAGIPQQVNHGETGFLVSEGDVDSMAEYMIQLATSPELRVRMGQSGRRMIERTGDIRDKIEELRQVLESVSTGRSTGMPSRGQEVSRPAID